MINALISNTCHLRILYVPRKTNGISVEAKYFKNIITVFLNIHMVYKITCYIKKFSVHLLQLCIALDLIFPTVISKNFSWG